MQAESRWRSERLLGKIARGFQITFRNDWKYNECTITQEIQWYQTQVEAIQPIMPVRHQHHTNLSTQDPKKKMQILILIFKVFLWLIYLFIYLFIYLKFLEFVYLLICIFWFLLLRGGGMGLVKKHTQQPHNTHDETPTNSTPYPCTQSPINAQAT